MRKYLFIITAFLFIFQVFNFLSFDGVLKAETLPEYYQITADEAVFYRSATGENAVENIYCTLPRTYFIKTINTSTEGYIFGSYLGVQGYIETKNVVPVYSTPQSPYAIRTFDIIHTASAVAWSNPTTESEYVGTISYDTTEVIFVGSTLGQKIQESDTGIWYLCRFATTESANTLGYVYSDVTTNLTEFAPNTEEVLYEPIQETNGSILSPELTNTSNIMLILLLTIPAVIILLLIIHPKKGKKQSAKRQIATLNQLTIKDKKDQDEFDF